MSSMVSSSSSCWTCATCTLLNPATKRRCEACNSRKPLIELHQQHQVVNPFETTTNSTATATTASTSTSRTKPNNRKRKISERKSSTLISTISNSNSISGNNSNTITTTTTTTTDESDRRETTKKRNRKTSSDDQIGDDDNDDGNIDTTISGRTTINVDFPVKDLNDDIDIDIDIHTDIENTKKIHSNTIDNINASNASASDILSTNGSDSNYTDDNNFNNNVGNSYIESVAKSPQLCLDKDSNVAEEEKEQQQQQQQDEQSTSINHHADIENLENHHNLQQEQQCQEQEQPSRSNAVNSSQSPVVDDDEKKAVPEKQSEQIIIESSLQLQLTESTEKIGKQQNNNEHMLLNITNDSDGIEPTTTMTTNTRSSEGEEENSTSSIERHNFDNVIQIASTSTTTVTISETISESKICASGVEETSSISTTTVSATEGMREIIMDTRKEGLSHTINQNNDNDDVGDFDNNDMRHRSSLRSNEDTILTTINPQSPPTQQQQQQQQQQIQDNIQADDLCIDENKYDPSSTQSHSSPFAYPMTTSFAYTPPGTGTQSSQEGMAEGDDDDDDDDDDEQKQGNSTTGFKKLSYATAGRQEQQQQQQNQQRNEYMYRQSMKVSRRDTDNKSGIRDLKMSDVSSSSLSNHPRENYISSSSLATDRTCLPEETTANNNKRKHAAVVTIEGGPKSNMNFQFRTTSASTTASTKTHSTVASEKIISNPFALFQTAGTGSSISVSKESVEKAGKLLNMPSRKEPDSRKTLPEASSMPLTFPTTSTSKTVAPSSTKIPLALFQTAGTGSSISVSKESVEKYGKLLNTSSRKEPDSRKTLLEASSTPPRFPTTTTSKTVATSSTKAPMAMFQTAGTGSSISVSKESVEKARKLLNTSSRKEPDSRKTLPEESSTSSTYPTTTSKTVVAVVAALAPTSTKAPMAMFQTAGNGSSISVSKESVEEMGKILSKSPTYRKESASIKILPEASSKNFPPSSASTNLSMAMFQTAGSGAVISVSEELLEDAGRLLKKKSSSSSNAPASKQAFSEMSVLSRTPMTSFQTPRSDTITKNNYAGATETNLSAAMAMFQTAGSGAAIFVSEERLEDAGRMLKKSPSSSNDSAPNKAAFSGASSPTRAAIASFQTPRSNTMTMNNSAGATETNVSAVMMAMFQTAGSGAAIHVSEERLKEGERMLNKSSSPSSNDSVSKKAFSGGASSPSRTAIASFQTSRSDTITKNNSAEAAETNAAMMVMFQTAGSGATLSVAKERLEDAGRMLNKSSSSSKESAVKNVDDETVGRREISNVMEGRLYTPTKNAMTTPHQNIVRFGSIRRATYGSTPLAFSNNDDRDYVVPLKPVAADGALGDCQIEATVSEQDLHSSPKEYNMASKSAYVTMSAGDSILVRKRKGEQNGAMTPVPINFSNKLLGTPDAFETPGLSESTPGYNSPNTEDCPTLQDAIRLGVMSKCPKVCRLNGVREVTMSVNCENALQLLFDSEGLPVVFALNTEDDHFAALGRIECIRKALITNGCDSKRIKNSWIRNHTRWIVWKLASYERSFSRFLGGNHLTYQMLIQNLTSRFRKELIEGVRPTIRKILNRDIAPSKMMCLVVCRIIPSPKSKSDDTSQPLKIVELSDGWYSVKGCLDKKMSEYVDVGLITVGTKLLVSNARLMGLEEGVDPLDEGDGTSCENCKGALQLTVNACRLAGWNAKLGFVKATNNERMSNGRLLVTRISDAVPGGGDIPAIRLFMQRVYPMLYYEKSEHCSQVLTVQEEDTMRREFENRKLKVMEKLTDRIQAEVEQEVDESSPDVWKRMMKSLRPEEIYETFDNQEKTTISRWREQRNALVHRRVQQEVEAELETDTTLIRESKNFQRVRVYSIDPKTSRRESALLTIWQPTEEQLGLLIEGTAVEIHNLALRDATYDGSLQLIANSRTVIESFTFQASSLIEKIGFRQRRFLNIFQVHKLSHEATHDRVRRKQSDFDVAAVQIHVVESSDSSDAFSLYVTDETNLILRIHCKKPPLVLKTLLSGEKRFSPYAMRDLVICPFDQEQQCAVAEFRDMSSVVMSNEHVERLKNWVSLSSQKDLSQIAAYLRAGLPLWKQDSDQKVSLGYIMGLRTESKDKIYIEVDCCGHGCYEWKLPARVLQQMISTISVDDLQVSLCPEQEDRISKFGMLSKILRARGILWRFQLSSVAVAESVVCSATEANKHIIGLLYETFQQ